MNKVMSVETEQTLYSAYCNVDSHVIYSVYDRTVIV